MFITPDQIIWASWNLFLGFVPFFISCVLFKYFPPKPFRFRAKIIFVLLCLLWFFFFPNIPYLFLDMRHIMSICEKASLNRCFNHPGTILILYAFTVTGIPLFVLSLEKMRILVARFLSEMYSYCFLFFICIATAFALHLGLLERFNSWDVVIRTRMLFDAFLQIVTTPAKMVTVVEFTISLLFLFFFFRFFFVFFERILQYGRRDSQKG